MPYILSLAELAAILYAFYQYITADSSRPKAALNQPFPPALRSMLAERVALLPPQNLALRLFVA